MQSSGNEQHEDRRDDQSPCIYRSKFLSGLQCPKRRWHQCNAKDLIPEPDASTQAIFDQGHEIGRLAKQLFPGGIEIAEGTRDFSQVVAASRQAPSTRRPLFEAGFTCNGGYVRVDILNPVGNDVWDIVEVKSSTDAKHINVWVLAFQA